MRQSHMVGVHMGHDHPQYGQALEFSSKDLLPLFSCCFMADAAVDHAPALHAVEFIAQQPKVDVVECKGQRHAYPFHPGSYRQGRTRFRQCLGKRVMQLFFQLVQGDS